MRVFSLFAALAASATVVFADPLVNRSPAPAAAVSKRANVSDVMIVLGTLKADLDSTVKPLSGAISYAEATVVHNDITSALHTAIDSLSSIKSVYIQIPDVSVLANELADIISAIVTAVSTIAEGSLEVLTSGESIDVLLFTLVKTVLAVVGGLATVLLGDIFDLVKGLTGIDLLPVLAALLGLVGI